jgi:glutamate carboxypeptidase
VTSRKGRAEYRIRARGVAAHAGSAHAEGINAIGGLCRAIGAAEQLTDYARGLTVNVGAIRGGTVVNRVPHMAEADLEIRAFEPETLANACSAIESLAAPLEGAHRKACIEVECLGKSPAWPTQAATERLFAVWDQVGASLGLRVERTARGGLSDANYLWSLGPTLDGLGPSGGNAHCSECSADGSRVPEYVEMDSFVPKALWNLLSLRALLEDSGT